MVHSLGQIQTLYLSCPKSPTQNSSVIREGKRERSHWHRTQRPPYYYNSGNTGVAMSRAPTLPSTGDWSTGPTSRSDCRLESGISGRRHLITTNTLLQPSPRVEGEIVPLRYGPELSSCLPFKLDRFKFYIII